MEKFIYLFEGIFRAHLQVVKEQTDKYLSYQIPVEQTISDKRYWSRSSHFCSVSHCSLSGRGCRSRSSVKISEHLIAQSKNPLL